MYELCENEAWSEQSGGILGFPWLPSPPSRSDIDDQSKARIFLKQGAVQKPVVPEFISPGRETPKVAFGSGSDDKQVGLASGTATLRP